MDRDEGATARLTTARLTLAPHVPADLDESAELWSDPRVVRYLGAQPSTRAESWARLLRHAGAWALLGYGFWVARERETGRFVGEVGFGAFERDLTPTLGDAPEAGWILSPWAHGAGYATEAALAAMAWADARLAAQDTVCMISPDNGPSLRVAAKCGYIEYARAIHRGAGVVLLRRPRPGNAIASPPSPTGES
ncbi:MAG: GNAT family N-acetyltransferase [Caulobacteraceae bacterium]